MLACFCRTTLKLENRKLIAFEIHCDDDDVALQAQRRRAILVECHGRHVGKRDGRSAYHHGEVRQHHRQLGGGTSCAIFACRWQQSIHDDGGAGFPLRLNHHCATQQSATLALHDVLPYAAQMPRQPANMPDTKSRRMGDGYE